MDAFDPNLPNGIFLRMKREDANPRYGWPRLN